MRKRKDNKYEQFANKRHQQNKRNWWKRYSEQSPGTHETAESPKPRLYTQPKYQIKRKEDAPQSQQTQGNDVRDTRWQTQGHDVRDSTYSDERYYKRQRGNASSRASGSTSYVDLGESEQMYGHYDRSSSASSAGWYSGWNSWQEDHPWQSQSWEDRRRWIGSL